MLADDFPRERRANSSEQFHRYSPKSPLTPLNDTPTVRTSRPSTHAPNSTATAECCDADHISEPSLPKRPRCRKQRPSRSLGEEHRGDLGRRLARKSPKTGQRRSLRTVAAELAVLAFGGLRSIECCRREDKPPTLGQNGKLTPRFRESGGEPPHKHMPHRSRQGDGRRFTGGHRAYRTNRTIRSSKPGIAANTAAAKAFPDRGGGGYLGRSLARALGSESVIECTPARGES